MSRSQPSGFRGKREAISPPTTTKLSGRTSSIGFASSRLWMVPRFMTTSQAVAATIASVMLAIASTSVVAVLRVNPHSVSGAMHPELRASRA